MATESLPLGKLPPDLLAGLLSQAPIFDERVILGPGIGLDCAILDMGESLLVAKSDPITFASDEIGWYLVHINANDIATTGAQPRWLLTTALWPAGNASPDQIESIFVQVATACRSLGISLVGGHTEVTASVTQPILIGTMLGEVEKDRLVTPRGARPGDEILLTKSVPIEATAILAREFGPAMLKHFSPAQIKQAAGYLHAPGISVLPDARLAMGAGHVSAMHDPTEGGLYGALWELAIACRNTLVIDPEVIPVSELSGRICEIFKINPFEAIASGALLLTAPPQDCAPIRAALQQGNIPVTTIGVVQPGQAEVRRKRDGALLPRPGRDEIARLFESGTTSLP